MTESVAVEDYTFTRSELLEITKKTIADLLENDAVMKDLPKDVTLEEVTNQLALQHGQSMTIFIKKDNGDLWPVVYDLSLISNPTNSTIPYQLAFLMDFNNRSIMLLFLTQSSLVNPATFCRNFCCGNFPKSSIKKNWPECSLKQVPVNATVLDLKRALRRYTTLWLDRAGISSTLSWKYVWKTNVLAFVNTRLDDDNKKLSDLGLCNKSTVYFIKKLRLKNCFKQR